MPRFDKKSPRRLTPYQTFVVASLVFLHIALTDLPTIYLITGMFTIFIGRSMR